MFGSFPRTFGLQHCKRVVGACRGSINGGFQTVVRVWSAEQIPAPHLNLKITSIYRHYKFTSVLPQVYLFLTSFVTSLKPLLSQQSRNHGLETTVYRTLGMCMANICPPFFCASFFPFFCPVRPTLPHAIFFPKIPSFWDLRSTLSHREKATCRGWVLGTVLDGVAPQEKKENPFFLAREKRQTSVMSDVWCCDFLGFCRSAVGLPQPLYQTAHQEITRVAWL